MQFSQIVPLMGLASGVLWLFTILDLHRKGSIAKTGSLSLGKKGESDRR